MEIHAQLRDYIARNLLFTDNGYGYDDDASFLEEGIVDSVGIMELVMFVEEKYGLSIEDKDLTPDNFDSINKLTHFIKQRLLKTV